MNRLEFKNKCRICLKDDADIHWDNVLNDCSNQTYKDCYYKYTQLECFDDENLSELLCHNCSDGLEYVDTFISQALDSHMVLDNYCLSMTIKEDSDVIEDGTIEVEEMFIEEEEEPNIESDSIDENSNKELTTITQNTKTSKRSNIFIERMQNKKINLDEECTGQDIIANDLQIEIMEETSQLNANKKPRKGHPMCCSICSKVFPSKYSAILHEKTHNQNRERNHTCDICGLKVINKTILKSHMQTHSKNREKPHKCEYCDKAFYYKGGLTTHQRLHLGLIVSCVICAKEYYRQIDLDQHMHTHSAERLNSNAKRKAKCYFRCKDCGKSVHSKSFRSHTAAHMNEPLFQCSICNKEFFRRDSCSRHLKKIHEKTSEETTNFIISYKPDRRSRLYLQQNAELQIFTEFCIQQIKMNYMEYKNKCRICLKDDADIHWDNVLNDYSNQTYKDCYYKYTQLECFDDINFSVLLCRNCSDGLEYIDSFISNALETHFVLDNYRLSMEIKTDSDVIDHGTTAYEVIFIEEAEQIESLSNNKNSNKELPTISQNNKPTKRSKMSIDRLHKQKEKSINSKRTTNKIEELNSLVDEFTGQDIKANDSEIVFMEETSELDTNKESGNSGPICCSICSKVFPNKSSIIRHEATHNENRERNETCNICGLAVYNKKILKYHMETHSTNREKPFKCEYCNKTFYHKGSLNRHRRLHLDEMVTCSICNKEFYRQIDLDEHMLTHSGERISSIARQKIHRYFHCKDCGKNIRADNFNSHTAVHMNEPLFKCSICKRGYFRRYSCVIHLKKVHQKTREDATNFIIAYKSDRRPRLYLQQHELEVLAE